MARRAGKVLAAVGVLAAPLAVAGLVAAGIIATMTGPSEASGGGCGAARGGDDPLEGFTEEQVGNASIIATVADQEQLPSQAVVISYATALQESGLRNLDYGDRDSIGLFQQRPSSGWGTEAQIMDPVLSAQAFFGAAEHTDNPGLLDYIAAKPAWQTEPVWIPAAWVQRPAEELEEAYQQWNDEAMVLTAALYGEVTGCVPVNGGWRSPVDPPAQVTSHYGWRTDPITGEERFHQGTDYAAAVGDPVYAVSGGEVTAAGSVTTWGGLMVQITHADGVQSWSAHLSAVDVEAGQTVQAGDRIGAAGATGRVTGPHLHLQMYVPGSRPGFSELTDPHAWLTEHGAFATGPEDGLDPDAALLWSDVVATWGETDIGGLAEGGHMEGSDHYTGHAIDVMILPYTDPDRVEQGWVIADWVVTNHDRWNVTYVIYQAQIWSTARSAEGWRPYTHPGGCTTDTCMHLDHLHVSVD